VADPQPKQVNVELPNDLSATYSNFAIISHSPSEVIIDFAQILPGPGAAKARVQARVLLTPQNAKMLHQALTQNLANYERRFGSIGGNPHGAFFDPKSGTLGGLQWTVGGSEGDAGDSNDKKDPA
jgi:hypothetical protein